LEDSHLKLHRIKPKWKNKTRAVVFGFVRDLHFWTASPRSPVDGLLVGWLVGWIAAEGIIFDPSERGG